MFLMGLKIMHCPLHKLFCYLMKAVPRSIQANILLMCLYGVCTDFLNFFKEVKPVLQLTKQIKSNAKYTLAEAAFVDEIREARWLIDECLFSLRI